GVDQDGLADAGELVEEFTHGQVQPGLLGHAAHQVGDLQGEHAGLGVDSDVVVGEVVHGGEGDHVWVFHLPEGELGLGLGAVAGHDLGDRPVVVVGDEHVLTEDLGFECGAGGGVHLPGQAVLGRGAAGQVPGDDPAYPGVGGDLLDGCFYLGTPAAGLASGQ